MTRTEINEIKHQVSSLSTKIHELKSRIEDGTITQNESLEKIRYMQDKYLTKFFMIVEEAEDAL